MGFDSVTVGVDDERSIVARPVIRAHSGLAIIATAGSERRGVKGIDTLPVRGSETEVKT